MPLYTSAGGSDFQVQYNKSGSFNGAAALIYATSTTHLTITGQAAGDKPLSLVPGVNSQALSVSGYSLTGSNTSSMLDLAGTWNTTGTPTAINIAITDTASNAGSLFAKFSNGTAVVSFGKGWISVGENANRTWQIATRDAAPVSGFPVPVIKPVASNKTLAFDFCPSGSPAEFGDNGWTWVDVCDVDVTSGNPPVRCARVGITSTGAEFGSRAFDGASVLPTKLCVNGTPVITLDTALNATVGGSTGAAKTLYVHTTTTTGYARINCVSNAAVAGNGCSFDHYGAGFTYDSSNYANWGGLNSNNNAAGLAIVTGNATAPIRFETGIFQASTNSRMIIGAAGNVGLGSGQTFGWLSTASALAIANLDVCLNRDAADVLAQRRSTNAQTFRVYETYTDASNYERASLSCASNTVTLAAQTAGTGTDNMDVTITPAGTGVVIASASVKLPTYTIASTLPAAATAGAGARAFVSDALAPAFGVIVAGSGAVFTPVYSDGSNWLVG